MNQAEKIRELVLNWLEIIYFQKSYTGYNDKNIVVNDRKVRAIKYSELKKMLLNNEEFKFTDGAITGALRTITDRVDCIFKVKAKDGVYYYYSDVEDFEEERDKVYITESLEYENIVTRMNSLHRDIGSILRDASNNKYLMADNTDIKYLRRILELTYELQGIMEDYKVQKSVEKIEDINPFV